MSLMKKGTLILAASIIAVLVAFFVFSRFFVDLLWFSSLGFRDGLYHHMADDARRVRHCDCRSRAAILLLNGFIAARATTAATGAGRRASE